MADHLAASQVPVILTGIHALATDDTAGGPPLYRGELNAPSYTARQAMWERSVPEVNAQQLGESGGAFSHERR